MLINIINKAKMGNYLSNFCCCKCYKNRTGEKRLYKNILIKPFDEELQLREMLLPQSEEYEIKPTIDRLSDIKFETSNCIIKRNCNPKEIYEWDELDDKLGQGAFGVVYKVTSKALKYTRSMKIIEKVKLSNPNDSESFINEIKILQKLEHPNIMKIFEIFEDENYFYIVCEYINEGNLLDIIQAMDQHDELIIGLIMYQIISAVAYLHKNGIVHGDLKPENIMISKNSSNTRFSFNTSAAIDMQVLDKICLDLKDKESNTKLNIKTRNSAKNFNIESGSKNNNNLTDNNFYSNYSNFNYSTNDYNSNNTNNLHNQSHLDILKIEKVCFKNLSNFQIKLIDFGCSKVLTRKHYKYNDIIGTSHYISPEVALNTYNEKCDLWSCGVIMYILISGYFPFEGETEKEIEDNILKYNLSFDYPEFENVSSEALDLIKKLMIYDPNNRISAMEALNHPFFTENFDRNNLFNENIDCSEALMNMRSFKTDFLFTKIMNGFISYNFISEKEIANLRKVFKLLDTNGDGMLSKEEITKGFKNAKLTISEKDLKVFMKNIDNNLNGLIKFEEFIRACSDKKKLLCDVNLKIAFDVLDEDKNGEVTKEEIRKIFFEKTKITDKALDEFLMQINKQENETILFEDFKNIMSKIR